ncbi:MAG: aminotransferase class I/II-fold pyridoxal phosphate-dependent enzyme [Prevotella sp.]|nr:aminotransferase class I/II-fold pyridoxal phosphate-dependent enzyme [Prevotella sp.]
MAERKRIYLCLAHMSEAGLEQKYIKEAFDTNWVVPLGPNVNGFEKDLEAFVTSTDDTLGTGPSAESKTSAFGPVPCKRVVALASGTSAVHLALIACGVKPGDEVIVQSFTFCASSHPITYLGATPVFVDSERETWNMDPELLEEAIKDRIAKTGKKPKAIVPVALYGMPYQIDRIMEIADRYEIPVIEDAAEGFGSRFKGQVLGTFGKYGVLSFNGNKMITTSGGGALITPDEESWREIMMYATQYRESYPYYQHEKIGYNYRMSNICAGIGRGQMTIVNEHIEHHKHVQALYEELLKEVKGVTVHRQPTGTLGPDPSAESKTSAFVSGPSVPVFDSNYWLCTITIDPSVKVKGQENAYKTIVTGAVGGAAGVIHAASSAVTDCQPNDNVEAMRVALDQAGIEARPVWKPMHKQPCYKDAPAYVNGVSEEIFKIGMCLPAGPYVTDDDVRYIVETIKANIDYTGQL